ncbi:RCC1 domain-containing protein 1 [Liparis tanakae]|uniref:RCC1 domain-containing protein 1 n=1 Tax=Liparis tanakae TaxID=230148 RepID=A0A4Z2JDI3_9TELE|nr:RCC1 domain-containing protein 1 [Liparis tanakae]
MRWFGFGFNAFGQIIVHEKSMEGARGDANEVKVSGPTELTSQADRPGCCVKTACDSGVCLAGFLSSDACRGLPLRESRGCRDALIGESCLTLAFSDRLESWDLQKEEKTPAWSMDIKTPPESSGACVALPLVPGGYIATKPPLYRSLSPQLRAKRLALSSEHAILLSASGAVYTWGLGSHGQLGHGGLASEEEPRAVEALLGMPMSCIATGNWHTVCISDGGDLYVWGWNESGQLGLPSRGLRKALQQQSSQQAATGDLYTWGWGDYGQLGHQTLISSDEPQRVEFFREQQMHVSDVVCGSWNTFAAVAKEEVSCA